MTHRIEQNIFQFQSSQIIEKRRIKFMALLLIPMLVHFKFRNDF